MTVAERIFQTRCLCEKALQEPAIRQVDAILSQAGVEHASRLEAIRASARTLKPAPALFAWRDRVIGAGVTLERCPLERGLLLRRIMTALDELESVPVDESVQHLFCKEFSFIADPFAEGLRQFSLNAWPFVAMTQLVLFERFPAGQHQWEISGFPRSWFAKVPLKLLPKTLRFLFLDAGGLRPFFSTHLSPTMHATPVLRDREFFQAFYRMALALERQPQIRAIFGASWLHSPETHRVNPHLAFMNQPFLQAGGIVTNIGPAQPDDGFMNNNKARAELYRSGQYKPTFGVAMCSRQQALEWRNAHQELGRMIAIK